MRTVPHPIRLERVQTERGTVAFSRPASRALFRHGSGLVVGMSDPAALGLGESAICGDEPLQHRDDQLHGIRRRLSGKPPARAAGPQLSVVC